MGSEAPKSIENSVFFEENFPDPVNEEDVLGLPSLDSDALDLNLSTQFLESEQNFLPSTKQSADPEEGPSMKSSEFSTVEQIDTRMILPHLLEAHGEAIDQNQKDLAEEIMRCMSQKAGPIGEDPLEAIVMSENPQGHFLEQEVSKHLKRLEDAIREAKPEDSPVTHIIEFDNGGMEAFFEQTLKLTSNDRETEEEISEHARSSDQKMKLRNKIKELKKRREKW